MSKRGRLGRALSHKKQTMRAKKYGPAKGVQFKSCNIRTFQQRQQAKKDRDATKEMEQVLQQKERERRVWIF